MLTVDTLFPIKRNFPTRLVWSWQMELILMMIVIAVLICTAGLYKKKKKNNYPCRWIRLGCCCAAEIEAPAAHLLSIYSFTPVCVSACDGHLIAITACYSNPIDIPSSSCYYYYFFILLHMLICTSREQRLKSPSSAFQIPIALTNHNS